MPSFLDVLCILELTRIIMGKFDVFEPAKFMLLNRTSKRVRKLVHTWYTPSTLITEKYLLWGRYYGYTGDPVNSRSPLLTVNGQTVVCKTFYLEPRNDEGFYGQQRYMLRDIHTNLVAILASSGKSVYVWDIALEQIQHRYTHVNETDPATNVLMITKVKHHTYRVTYKITPGKISVKYVKIDEQDTDLGTPIVFTNLNVDTFYRDYPSYCEVPTMLLPAE